MNNKWLHKIFSKWFGKGKGCTGKVEVEDKVFPTYLLENDDKESPMLAKNLCEILGVMRENPIIFNDMNDLLITLSKEFLGRWEHVKVKYLNSGAFDKLISSAEIAEAYRYRIRYGPPIYNGCFPNSKCRIFKIYGVVYLEET